MKKNLFKCLLRPSASLHLLILLLVILTGSLATASDLRVVLTGNTADFENADDLFLIIKERLRGSTDTVAWVLNGDVFPESYSDQQIVAWKTKANQMLDDFPNLYIILNQGDRDWDNSGRKGLKKIRSLEKLLSQASHPRFQVFLRQGCPGPWTISFPTLQIVVINSQWWNHPFEKPIPSSDACTIADTDNFIEELEGILDEVNNKNVLILSHFPLKSMGNYGGRFAASSYLFPPLIGNALVAFHQHVGTSKDIANAQFDVFRQRLSNVLHDYSSLIFASGHEQNQSIQKAGNNFYINSGASAGGGYVSKSKHEPLAWGSRGFIEITYGGDGAVGYKEIKLAGNQQLQGQSGWLMDSPCSDGRGITKNALFQPCKPMTVVVEKMQASRPDSVTVAAGAEYASSWFKQLWFGRHYRSSWIEPVKVPYLDLNTTYHGLKVIGKGGGRQTTSLKMEAADGKEYVFRSVNKDPYRALGYELRGTVVADVLKDQTSTQQPYGAMVVSPLLDKIEILHATPELFVLPDDDKMGLFRKDYANLFGMLEERPTDKIQKSKIFAGATDIEKSFKMFGKLYQDHDNHVEKKEFARARIFDLWIGDWSKHEDNWKWAGFKEGRGEVFRPVPRDRDHAFSRWDGIIPWIADREWGVPNGENFGEKVHGLRSLMWQARHLDRFVGNELTEQDWVDAAKSIQHKITDQDIEEAVKNMPTEIYDKNGKEIERKLKIRIKDLDLYAKGHYRLIARQVDVVGSNKKEYFRVIRQADGSVEVTVCAYDRNRNPDLSKIYYHRIFLPDQTREIRLFGLADDDIFNVSGEAKESILLRIVSGSGHDSVTDRSAVAGKSKKTFLYDRSEDTATEKGKELKLVKPKNDALYDYNRNAFVYNTYLPIALFTYNPFVGAAIHTGVTFTRQNFSKPDFSARHIFRASVSVKGNYDFSYANQFRQLVGKWDVISGMGVSRPLNYNYFFGIGNDTPNDNERSANYYRTQYNSLNAFAGITRIFWKKSGVDLTINYERDEGIKRNDSYLADHPDIFGADKLHLIFAKGALRLDLRDRVALPERGFLLKLSQHIGHVSDSEKKVTSISEVELEQYLSTYHKNPLTLGIRLGAGVTKGQLPFYKLFSLGQLNDLHGYRRNRFTGESKAFLNTELRYQLTQTTNSFIPLKVGVRGFYDLGQVWSDERAGNSKYWHKGYGAGFYITPFREQFAFNLSVGSSKEESLLLMISVGSFFR